MTKERHLLQQLRALEIELHQPEVRSDRVRMDELLHESFCEIGRSGKSYTKARILDTLEEEALVATIWSQDYAVAELAPGIALLTYRSAHDSRGELSRHTLRSSLWQRTERDWQLRFHHGTPTQPFERAN